MINTKLSHFGIRERLILFSVLLAIPLVMVGSFALWGLWEENQEQLNDAVEQQSQLASIAFERWIDDQQRPLTVLAAGAKNQKDKADVFSANLPFIIKTHPDWLDILLVSGKKSSSLTQPDQPTFLAENIIQELGDDIQRRKSWAVSSEQKSATEKPVLLVGVPLDSGEMLIAKVSEVTIADIFADLNLGDGVTLTIFDPSGDILYRSKAQTEPIATTENFAQLLDTLKEKRTTVGEAVSPDDGIQRLYGLAHAGETDCTVMIGIPSAPLREPARRQFVQYATLCLLALLAAIGAAILFSRLIVSPVQRLIDTAHLFGRGDLKARAEVKGKDEITRLALTFNQMADQIEEREERLTELDRLKSDFVSSVSHELRTPLTTIKTLTRLLLRGRIRENEKREYLETIGVECDRQIDLILNLLNLSRIEAGSIKFELKEVNVTELLQACERLEKHAAQAHGHSLRVESAADLSAARAEKDALRRVLCILIENAIKYTPEGGRITLSAEDDYAGSVLVKIGDNGYGIAPIDLPHIFEKFFRGSHFKVENDDETDAVTGDKMDEIINSKGIGLGLYLAHSLAGKMGGELSVESVLGKGSIFTLKLPVWENARNGDYNFIDEQTIAGS